MPPNDWAGIGVVLLLVLPTLAVACVLITAPFSQWIGRRHDEEEQVIRAPLLVACIAIAAEAGVAIWLLVRGLPAQGIIVDVGRSALRADAFAAGTVLTVSAIAFIALIAAELARPDRPLGLWDIIPVLCMWTVHVALGLVATRGGVAMATVLVSLTAGIVLIVNAWERPKSERVWATIVAVLLPGLAWGLMGAWRLGRLDIAITEAPAVLRSYDESIGIAGLVRFWLAAIALPAGAILAMTLIPKRASLPSPGSAGLVGLAFVSIVPSVVRISSDGFPSTHAYTAAVPKVVFVVAAIGLLMLLVAQAPLSARKRLALTCVGGLTALLACLSVAEGLAAGLVQASIAGAAVSVCLVVTTASEARGETTSAAPAWWPWSYAALAPILVALPIGWLGSLSHSPGLRAGALVALLAVAFLAAAARLAWQLLGQRPSGETTGRFAAARGWALGTVVLVEVLAIGVPLALVILSALAWLGDLPGGGALR